MGNQPASINLIMQNGPTPGQKFAIEEFPQTIGRGSGSQILIADKTLSRQHSKIWATPEGVVVEDLGSTNGTYINQQRISGRTRLQPGDILQLGEKITFTLSTPQGTPDDYAATMLMGNAPDVSNQTYVPGAPVAPIPVPATPQQQGSGTSPWVWVILAVIIAALIVGGALGYLYYANVYQAQQATPTVIVAVQPPAPPTASPTSIPTHTPTTVPNSTPGSGTSEAPTPNPIEVPGVPAAGADERQPPPDITNKIDPFCGKEVEIKDNEPVLITWQQRVAEDSKTDYINKWLEATTYDLRVGGRAINQLGGLHYYRNETCGDNGLCGPTLNFWVNVGLLETGKNYVTIEWYADREVSSGLDIDPADGQVDTFGPGKAGEGTCDIVVVAASANATANAPAPNPTASQVQQAPAPVGIFQDFEKENTWKRGDQPYGELTRTSAQVHSGSYAGQLGYHFPSTGNDYVVFLQNRSLAGRPNAISAWVYGDGSGHFLNVWIKDAGGQTWAMNMGQVSHTGWKEMTAVLDPAQPWPSGHISGANNNVIDYPISFQGLVLDDSSDTYSGSGSIYIDDISSKEGVIAPPTTQPSPGGGIVPGGGQPVPPSSTVYVLSIGNQHRYEEPWGAPIGGPCRAWENNDWDDRHPDYRGFNVELLLTNKSTTKVQDDWGESLRFFTSGGQEVDACYYGYNGAGPVPSGTTSLTFFTVVPKGQFVQTMQLNLNGQFSKICLDGRGGWSYCN